MAEPELRPRYAPKPTPETEHFWEGTRNHELLLQRCKDCGTVYFPPRAFCPTTGSGEVEIFKASGKAKLVSYMINHRQHPSFHGPYAIAVVQLEEGPMMMTNIVNCEQTPEALQLDMDLEVVFEKVNDEVTVALFQPTGA
ncbi:MAG: Zn-ribbon domain-containing OB-fold protein [Gammaproteobacteria bacterium]|nr:Zn-ribbon domain-containing OB-fold protein [Gammaproteobacteria bacterium]